MITLKEWNNMSQAKRTKVSSLLFYNMPDWYKEEMSREWHHKVDAVHSVILKSIYKKTIDNKDHYIFKPTINL